MDNVKKIKVVENFIKGDINKDGRLDISDVVALVDKLIEYQEELNKYDFNKDGKVSVADLTSAMDKIMSGDEEIQISDLTSLVDYLLDVSDKKDYDIDENETFDVNDVKSLINKILES